MAFYFYSYIIVLGASLIAGGIRYNLFDRASKLFLYTIALAFICEVAAHIAAEKYKNNMPVYHVYNIINLALLFLYFFEIARMRKRLTYILSLLLIIAAGVGNIILFQPILQLNSNILLLSSFVTILLCLYTLYKMLVSDTLISITRYVHFWIICSLLLTSSCTYFFWGYYEIFQSSKKVDIIFLIKLNWAVNVLNYLFLGILFFQYKKFTETWTYDMK